MTEVSSRIQAEAHEEANIIVGVIFDENLGDAMQVTVIATGIQSCEIGLPENVKSLHSSRKEKVNQQLPFDEQEEQPSENRDEGKIVKVGSQLRNTFPQSKFVDEEEFETPAYLRRKEN